jgi:hypothetical protein
MRAMPSFPSTNWLLLKKEVVALPVIAFGHGDAQGIVSLHLSHA